MLDADQERGEYPKMKKTKAITDWLEFNNNPNTFNDIRFKNE